MIDQPNPATGPAPAARRVHAEQDQRLANRINQYRTALTALQGNAGAAALLQPRGYPAEALAAGLALCDAAQVAFNARQDALAAHKEATANAAAAKGAARSAFDDFRKIARSLFKADPAAQSALGVVGRVPEDEEKFQTVAAAAYAAAQGHSSYQALLSKRGYAPAALQAEAAKLAALTQANAAEAHLHSVAKQATAGREAAARSLDAWWSEFRVVAAVAFKPQPALQSLLG